ncbi:hypothetical protein D3C74_427860 [compost metagenome]
MSSQSGSGRLTDFTNTQSIQEPCEGRFFGFLQRIHHVLRGFWPHAIQSCQLSSRQVEQIRRRVDILFLDQLIDNFIAHPVDIHRPTGDEVFERFFALRPAD